MPLHGALLGLLAAALFGASAPVAKLMLPNAGPLMLAGLLYLGAGIGLTIFRVAARRARVSSEVREARLVRGDLPLLAGIVIAGGIAGPVLMLLGLSRLSGLASSLLLNLEGPFTILIAVIAFGEHLGAREAVGVAAILIGAALLGVGPGELSGDLRGALYIAGACASWGLDNNLTQRLSIRNPAAVVQVKTLGAGTLTLSLAIAIGQPLPAGGILVGALVLGSLSYGLSILLDTYALRILGAAREAAFFATAPFVGAMIAIPLLGDRPGPIDLGATVAMIVGLAILLRAKHSHAHTHEPIEHEHLHVHDAHHQHAHDETGHEPHSHRHRHEPITHEHPHVPDVHHRHSH
jgi:drug/metabolite transporter (DMT)-like permease